MSFRMNVILIDPTHERNIAKRRGGLFKVNSDLELMSVDLS